MGEEQHYYININMYNYKVINQRPNTIVKEVRPNSITITVIHVRKRLIITQIIKVLGNERASTKHFTRRFN